MTFLPLSSQNSQSTNNNQINNMIRDLNKRERVEVFKDDSGTRRVLLGKGANGFYGLKVSQEGKDVYTATDSELSFNSDDRAFILVEDVDLELTFTRSSSTFASYTTSVAHGLSYTPEFLYDLSIDPGLTAVPPTTKFNGMYVFSANVGGTYTPFGQAYVTVDDTSVYFQVDISTVASGTYTCTAKVYLLQVPFGVI